MLKGDVSLVDVVVAGDAVFFAVVVCTACGDVAGVSVKPATAFVTGATDVSPDAVGADGARVVRFDVEAERGAVEFAVDVSVTVAGKTMKLPGPSVPARA